MLLLGPEKESHYSTVIANTLMGEGVEAGSLFSLQHLHSILEAWHTHWLLYWLSEYSVTYIVILLLLLFAIAGWFFRLKNNQIDAWYVFFYLAVLAVWPHPGQMLRLLLPVVPLLLIYGFSSVLKLEARYLKTGKSYRAGIIVYALLLVSVAPVHAFMHGRIELAKSQALVPVYEIFRKPDVDLATRDLLLHNQMLADFTTISRQLDPGDSLIYYAPAYPAVLGKQMTETLAYPLDSDRHHLNVANNRYVLLTALHPRRTREGVDGFSAEQDISTWTEKTWCSSISHGKIPVSCLYRVTQ